MSFVRSFFTVSFFTLLSRITGYMRDMMIAAIVGAGPLAEVYLVAFKLPNFFRRMFAEGAFNAAFVPMYAGKLAKEGQAEALSFAESILSVLLLILIIFELLMILFMPYVMIVMAPGFLDNKEQFELASTLTRITFPYLLLISLVSLYSGILNSVGKFAVVASAPLLLNFSMMGMLYFAAPYLPSPAHALAKGITLAGVLQLAWVMYGCRKAGIRLRLRRPRMSPQVKMFLRKMAPGIVGAGVVQINLWVDVMIATFFSSAIAFLYYADRVSQLPLSLIGTAMGTAMLPLLSKQIREGLKEQAMVTQNRALEMTMFLTLPAAAALCVLAHPIITVLFERGEFSADDATATAYALPAFALGLPAFVLVKILMAAFFASGDTKTPVQTAIVAMIVNVILNVVFIFSLKAFDLMPHIGIALATTFASWLNVAMLLTRLKERGLFHADDRLKSRLWRIGGSTFAMVLVLVGLQIGLQGWLAGGEGKRTLALMMLCAVGGGTFFVVAYTIKAFDLKEIIGFLKRGRKKPPVPKSNP